MITEKIQKQLKNPDFATKLGALCALGVLCMLVEMFRPGFYVELIRISTSKRALIEYLGSFGPWSMAVSFLLDVLINAVGFLPSIFISTANGLIFGLPWGITISWLAETVGVVISFILMRFFFRDTAEVLIEKSNALQHLDSASGKDGFWWMMFARALPYFPSGLLTAVGALSSISLRDYVLANLLGKLPSTALEVVIGHDVVNFGEHSKRLALWVCLGAGLFFAVKYLHERWGKKEDKKE